MNDMLPKMNGYVKTFNDKDGHKTKYYKLMSLRVNGNKLLEKFVSK